MPDTPDRSNSHQALLNYLATIDTDIHELQTAATLVLLSYLAAIARIKLTQDLAAEHYDIAHGLAEQMVDEARRRMLGEELPAMAADRDREEFELPVWDDSDDPTPSLGRLVCEFNLARYYRDVIRTDLGEDPDHSGPEDAAHALAEQLIDEGLRRLREGDWRQLLEN
jgi:hypothetical protein